MTFGEVYAQHFRFVWRSLRRLGVPESDVADAVQDVFLVVPSAVVRIRGSVEDYDLALQHLLSRRP